MINILVLAAAAWYLARRFRPEELLSGWSPARAVILLLSVVLVHAAKSLRLYLAMYGTGLRASAYFKTYCKVTPVSMLLPFKTGDFFRMYCYGAQIGSGLKGIIIVLLDRFMDTAALVTMVVAVWLFRGGGRMMPLVYLLLMFLLAILLVYYLFPGIYAYWKKYLLRAAATPGKMRLLGLLERMSLIHKEIAAVARGRGILLYALSLLAWAAEIGNIIILRGMNGAGPVHETISGYLTAALSGDGSSSAELQKFVFVSVLLMILLYAVIKLYETASAGKRTSL